VVTALTAPLLVSGAVEASHRFAEAGQATWVVPSRLVEMPAPPLAGGPPIRVRIPSIKVDSALEALAVNGGTLASPTEFDRAGWYADGTVPGDTGPAVIAGHVDSRTGPAVFFRLHELKPGAEVDVERGGQWLVFNVTAVERHPKARFPSEKVYGATPAAELRLITCGGIFDTRHNAYRDNVVVYAVLAPETG
jgi:sortase (surface protein transpeptidase)